MLEPIGSGQPVTKNVLEEGGLFLVDKPMGWTSFDVVNKLRATIRHKRSRRKYKVGHAGTLDPLATGLLLVCFSSYTKKIQDLTGLNKSYIGTITLWAETPSYDAEFMPSVYHPRQVFSRQRLEEARQTLEGLVLQDPPRFSAIKKGGVALYKLARKGKEVRIEPREVHIRRFKITRVELPLIDFEITCSKGTYIRSIAHDFGKALGNGAFLSRLTRTSIGDYRLSEAWKIEALVSAIKDA